ncbi:40S ribosomal protein S9-2 [Acorus gramineus]|uniref:40S ribosomal protein S9-2 n=1 Tax=Acorus gramineus TaxID=55184 RepID=A0AAV9AL08_ACOGR|nr:40S ribosomal protein S9-2 [Acorus gramineus]
MYALIRIRNAARELLMLEEKNMWRIVEGEDLLRRTGFLIEMSLRKTRTLIVSVLPMSDLKFGKQIHEHVIKEFFKIRHRFVFSSMVDRGIVSWTR